MRPIPEPLITDARAKIVWGEPVPAVMEFLQKKGVGRTEAQALLAELVSERSREIRRIGLRKLWTGLPLILLPLAYDFFIRVTGHGRAKLYAVFFVAGAYGLFRAIDGLIMVLRPKSVTRDLTKIDA